MTALHSTAAGPLRAAIYTRVSTDDQANEGYGLADQERRGREVAAREGWDVTVYSDPARSGADRDRPGLARMLADVEAGALEIVWFDSQDRLARDVAHTADLIAAFIVADVTVWEGWGPVDLGDDGQAQVDLKALFAAWERRKIKARTRKGIAQRAREGQPWGTPSYGYQSGDDGHWGWEPDEAAIVPRIYEEYTLRRPSFSGVARWLNEERIPSRNGGRWSPPVVARIITGRAARGEFWHAGEWHPGSHEPIIDEATWKAAQAIATQGKKFAPGRAGRLPKRHLLVRGMGRCSEGEALLPRTDSRKNGETDTYVCRARKVHGSCPCGLPPLDRRQVDRTLVHLFERAALDVDATRKLVAEQLDTRAADVRRQADRAAADVVKAQAGLERVERDYVAGALSAATAEPLLARLRDQRDAAEAEHTRLTTRVEDVADALAGLDAESETLRRLSAQREAAAGRIKGAEGDVQALRAALASAFECITVSADRGAAVEGGVHSWGAHDLVLTATARPEMLLADRALRRVAVAFEVGNNTSGSGVPLTLFSAAYNGSELTEVPA
jgi:site-specific DNA recombinase